MANPIKIFEIKGEDWAKGLSYSNKFTVGGLFATYNTDPFKNYGYFSPRKELERVNNLNSTIPRFINSFSESGTKKLYIHGDTSLYEVLDGTPWTGTSKSSEINVASRCTGAIIHKNKYVYAQSEAPGKIRANAIPVASGSDVLILNGLSSSADWNPMCVSPDKYIYFGNSSHIGRLESLTGTSGNTNAYYNLETGFVSRDLVSDGRYLIAIADNNWGRRTNPEADDITGSYRCQVYFFDVNNGRSTADYIYEFTDSYLISVKVLDGVVYIIGRDNIYACNSQTQPKVVFSFKRNSTITNYPKLFNVVKQNDNFIYWASGSYIYSFGSNISGIKKVFATPYAPGNTTALALSGELVYMGYYNSGASYSETVIGNYNLTQETTGFSTPPIFLPQPFKYAYSKISFRNRESVWGVSYGLITLTGLEVTNYANKNYNNFGAKDSIIFNKEVDSGNPPVQVFDQFAINLESNVDIYKLEIWAYPVDNYEQI